MYQEEITALIEQYAQYVKQQSELVGLGKIHPETMSENVSHEFELLIDECKSYGMYHRETIVMYTTLAILDTGFGKEKKHG
jgi:hypothetical protein